MIGHVILIQFLMTVEGVSFEHSRVATGTRYATLQHNLGYDMFLVVGKSAYSVNRIVIACVVIFRDLSKVTSGLGMCFANRFML